MMDRFAFLAKANTRGARTYVHMGRQTNPDCCFQTGENNKGEGLVWAAPRATERKAGRQAGRHSSGLGAFSPSNAAASCCASCIFKRRQAHARAFITRPIPPPFDTRINYSIPMSKRELEETFEKVNLQPFAVHCLEASKQRK